MIIPRLASTALRAAQFICAAVVLGLSSYLLHLALKHNVGPMTRLFFSIIIASISVVASLLFLLPTTSHIVNFTVDLLFCAAWFSVFGLLQDTYEDGMLCGSKWHWENMGLRENMCGLWNATQAFAFLSAVFWFASFVLGLLVWKGGRTPVAAAPPVTATTGRKRWFGRSRV